MTQIEVLWSHSKVLYGYLGLGLQSTPHLFGQSNEGFPTSSRRGDQQHLVYGRHQTTGSRHQGGESGTKVDPSNRDSFASSSREKW